MSNQNVHLSTREDLTLRRAQGLVQEERGFTAPEINSYKFNPDAFPSSLTDQNKINRVQDSPRIQSLKELLQLLFQKVSTDAPDASRKTLKAELDELIGFFKEIFRDNKKEELNALRISFQALRFRGKSRVLKAIAVCKEIDDEMKKVMKVFIAKEAPRR